MQIKHGPDWFRKILVLVERVIVLVLLVMMILVVVISTLELGWMLITQFFTGKGLPLDASELLNTFSFFLLILIGLELMETIKMYLDQNQVHVEVVFLVAMIAVARKVIVLDAEKYPPLAVFGIAAVIFALSVGYYLVKRTHHQKAREGSESEET
ncbi:MAG: phosphate-starvation-inducible PsiE family protein [Proteobacteria bacterium]|nr:phosphate-starvation-inducible PsiE family protein [Pseudomonadota bacterium]MBU1742163.1 phosphate-starvation-inducible PsiE family protein [Pseudomonadota bacterium]